MKKLIVLLIAVAFLAGNVMSYAAVDKKGPSKKRNGSLICKG